VPRSPFSITKFPTCAPLCRFFRSPCSIMYPPLFLRSVLQFPVQTRWLHFPHST
jgi:hypothetical protein